MKILSRKTLAPFDWFLILGVIIADTAYMLLAGDFDIMGFLACTTGVFCVVLCAKRSIANYVFGVINVSLYAFISYKSRIYGDAVLNAFYYFPMQFIGFYLWIRHKGGADSEGRKDDSIVKASRMSFAQRIMLALFSLFSILAAGWILSKYTSDPQPYKDSATTVLSVIAMYLMVRTYMEQWALWIIVNLISIAMWVFVWLRGDPHSALMAIMYIFYLINSINGMRLWNRALRRAAV
ncbi:MAG: nicotinamide riboside transporter PnuC [Bacteroidales bacterium]|jgi:nicotinamide mononucleotide transporter|nr:nicotinamide riboside transporter PnuC [Bacteroidales bacterium]